MDLVNARPAKDHKKGADTGIDGYINFFDDKSGQAKQVIMQAGSQGQRSPDLGIFS